jgi:hypothetical protein
MDNLANQLMNENLFATSMLAIATDQFTTEFLEWEPETLEIELRHLCPNMPGILLDRLNAAVTALTVDTPHRDLRTFCTLTRAFNFNEVDRGVFIAPSLDDALWGCTEMRIIEGPQLYDEANFSPEIKTYVAQLLSYNALTDPPKALEFAEPSAEEIMNRDINLGGDSIAFDAYWETQRDAKKAAVDYVNMRTVQLLQQLASLRLKGASKDFYTAVGEAINVSAAEESSDAV